MAQTEHTQDSAACPHCGGSGWTMTTVDGVETARRCSCSSRERAARRLARAAIPERYQHCTLDSFEIWNPDDPTLVAAQRMTRDFVDAFPEVDRGLLLMGGVGTGKTHLAVAVLRELIQRHGVAGRFADFTTLVQDVQLTFDGSGGSRAIIEPLVRAEVLVLDELGAGKTTPWVSDLLYYVVNSRYLDRRITLFTTNFSDFPKRGEESLTDRVSARIRSRLYEMCRRVELRGDDFRHHRLAAGKEKASP